MCVCERERERESGKEALARQRERELESNLKPCRSCILLFVLEVLLVADVVVLDRVSQLIASIPGGQTLHKFKKGQIRNKIEGQYYKIFYNRTLQMFVRG